jgi:catechol 2,3-dioxygenase-like lactoylglutathione lyase family enzyme
MRKALSTIDRIVILCRNAEKTAAIYTEALGLKVHLQSLEMV